MKVIKTLSENYDFKGLRGKLLLADPETVPLTPPELYIRSGVNEEWVEHLKQLVEEGADLDPVVIAQVEGKDTLVSGNHRVSAYRKLGKEIKVLHIGEISLEDFFKLQRELNPDILPMDTEELKRYAEKLYDHLKGKYEKKELYEKIADAVGRSPETVRKWLAGKEQEEKREKVRRAIELREKGWSLREIAKELNMTPEGVRKLLSTSGKESQKLTLLTPTSDPTPEGIRLFEEHLRSQDRLPPAWNWENFARWLEREGKEVEGDIKEFVMCFIRPMSKAFKLFAQEGETDYNAVKKYLSSKEPLSKLTSPSREKLFAWAERYWKKEVEKAQKQKELEEKILSTAEEILKDPSYTLTNWIDLSEEVAQKLGLSFEEVNPIISQHVTHLTEVYRQIPGVPEERIKEILSETPLEEFENSDQLVETIKAQVNQEGYRWTQKAEWAVINAYKEFEKAPPSPHDPSSDPSAGSQPALSEEVKEIEPGIPLYRPIPSKEKLYEMAYGGEEEEEKEKEKKEPSNRGRPAKPHYNVEEEIEIIIEEIKTLFLKLVAKCGGRGEGYFKALEIFEEIYEWAKSRNLT